MRLEISAEEVAVLLSPPLAKGGIDIFCLRLNDGQAKVTAHANNVFGDFRDKLMRKIDFDLDIALSVNGSCLILELDEFDLRGPFCRLVKGSGFAKVVWEPLRRAVIDTVISIALRMGVMGGAEKTMGGGNWFTADFKSRMMCLDLAALLGGNAPGLRLKSISAADDSAIVEIELGK